MRLVRDGIGLLVFGLIVAVAGAAPSSAAEQEQVVVLDAASVWRSHYTLRPPVIQCEDGLKTILVQQPHLNWETAGPPAGWREPDFDDTGWLRGSARMACWTPYLARACLRGRFTVTDPDSVNGLSLSVDYHGGVIVYVNGNEVASQHLPGGADALAEGYPLDAFVTDEGDLLPSSWQVESHKRQLGLRKRTLGNVQIPRELLREGVNVVAVEVVRAPYHEVVEEKKGIARSEKDLAERGTPYNLPWNTCEIVGVRLAAPSEEGLIPNAGRPAGLQVWNSDPLTADYDTDIGDRCEPLRPIALVGVRNGSFSGRAVLGSPGAVRDLKATASDLKGEAGLIPAREVRIRYGIPWGQENSTVSTGSRGPSPYPRGAALLGGLIENPLPEFPVREVGGTRGAVVPIWVTVRVPPDAMPGAYRGVLSIETMDGGPVEVPISLKVLDWTLPDRQDWRTWVELVQSPDTLAIEYDVPLWSDRHWEMIAHSFDLMGETGSRVVYVPLICHTNYGNEQSMVRWISKGEGGYEYDFSIMEKYLELAEKHMGRPAIVAFTAWDIYLSTPKEAVVFKESDSSFVRMEKEWAAARWDLRGKGPAVTVVDPATGETEMVYLPRYEDPASEALWGPLFAELRDRMTRRGLAETMALAMLSDRWPTKEEIRFLSDVSGGLPWVSHTHGGSRVRPRIYDVADIVYTVFVWNVEYNLDPTEGRTYGWKRPELVVQYKRFKALNQWPATTLRHFGEFNISGGQRGVGRIGADFWPAVRDKRGRRAGQVWGRYLQSRWHSLDLFSSLLGPGPSGPMATTRYEIFREGIQECEARISIERALTDEELRDKLGPALAGRCQDALDERVRYMWKGASGLQLTGRAADYASRKSVTYATGGVAGHCWFVGSGWQGRTEKLYALAGEVQRKLEEDGGT